jgi:hypothetical protein
MTMASFIDSGRALCLRTWRTTHYRGVTQTCWGRKNMNKMLERMESIPSDSNN